MPKPTTSVIADLPRAGLANMLLVWARAVVFSHNYCLPLVVTGWSQIRIGPWLRREKTKRLYHNYFRGPNLQQITSLLRYKITMATSKRGEAIKDEPESITQAHAGFYRFSETPEPPDFFAALRAHRTLIRSELHAAMSPRIHKTLGAADIPDAAIHVRRGDFLRETDPKYGHRPVKGDWPNSVTPLNFFQEAVTAIRRLSDAQSIMIFTDGAENELTCLLSEQGVAIAPRNPDIVDLLVMSQATILVPSARSTFSYFAAFLSDAEVIRFGYPGMASIRGNTSDAFEGTLQQWISTRRNTPEQNHGNK